MIKDLRRCSPNCLSYRNCSALLKKFKILVKRFVRISIVDYVTIFQARHFKWFIDLQKFSRRLYFNAVLIQLLVSSNCTKKYIHRTIKNEEVVCGFVKRNSLQKLNYVSMKWFSLYSLPTCNMDLGYLKIYIRQALRSTNVWELSVLCW